MLAIAGGKGGVGKTTVTLALAGSLADAGHTPVALDADVDMPDLHVLAGTDREPTADALAAGRAPGDVVQRPRLLPGVGVVAAGRPDSVPAALRRLRRWHGPVLVDCPAGASGDAARPLRECDGSVLVTTHTPAALENTARTAAVARRLDAAPLAVVVRGEAETADRVFDCPVERVPDVDTRPVHADSRLRTVCGSIRRRASDDQLCRDTSARHRGRYHTRNR